MFKRIASIFLILIVNILLLTHAVLPHHHHENIPCFTVYIHQEDGCGSNHNTEKMGHIGCCQHEKKHNQSENTCILEQLIVVATSESKDNCLCITCTHDHSGNLLQAVLFSLRYNFITPEKEIHFRQPPYLISYHSIFASHSLGLRAPPMA